MSSESVGRILKEVKRLSAAEQRELREALALNRVPLRAYNIHDRERAWVEIHRDEYLNEWVAIDGDTLIAHGPNAREVYLAAREAGVEVPYVEHLRPQNELPFGGW